MQADRAAVVTADGALPTSLLDQDLSDPLMTAGHGLAHTALAPPPASVLARSVSMELDHPVLRAQPKLRGAVRRWRATGFAEEGNWGRRCLRHERMFPHAPDEPAANTLNGRAVSSTGRARDFNDQMERQAGNGWSVGSYLLGPP